MFADKEYQIKDIMELYNISRDTIKYYEKAGLISSSRRSNGYRVFDEINMRKLKKILSFRGLGMTIDEIAVHCNCGTAEERMEALTAVRLRTEAELRDLNQKLKQIRNLERSVSENLRFSRGFNAGSNLNICFDCPHINGDDYKNFMVISGMQASYSKEEGLTDIQHGTLIFNKEIDLPQCRDCDRRVQHKEYYRSRIPYESKLQIEELLQNEVDDLAAQGLSPSRMVYMMKKVICMDKKDRLILDTILPIEENKNS